MKRQGGTKTEQCACSIFPLSYTTGVNPKTVIMVLLGFILILYYERYHQKWLKEIEIREEHLNFTMQRNNDECLNSIETENFIDEIN